MSKIKNSFSVLYHNKKKSTLPFGFYWAPFLIFQLFVALLVIQSPAWAGLVPNSLKVDANGDSIFNGDNEKLTISFTTDNVEQEYTYEIKLDDGRKIAEGPNTDAGQKLSKNQTVKVIWDGKIGNDQLPDGDYKIKVFLTLIDSDGNPLIDSEDNSLDPISSKEKEVTLDTKAPELSISIDAKEFSRILEDRFPIHYSGLDEDVAEAWLELQKIIGGDPIKRAIEPNELSKEGGIYYWDGKDNNSKPFFDGQYTLQLWVKDRGGNVIGSNKIETITIDSADNAAPTLESVATDKGKFITPGSGISGEMSFVEAILEDNIELNLDDSTIRLIGPSGSPVLGQQTRPADNKIRWQLLSPLLAKDGLQDGQYTIEIVGADKAGNRTSPIQISFLFDNLAPELVSLKPTRDGEAFNILGDTVYYNLPLNQFVATFNDGESGTGVTFAGGEEISRIVFGTPNADGGVNAISGRAFPDRNNSVLTYILDAPLLKSDGSQDRNYTLNVKAADPLGNTKTYTYRIIYDTQVPTLASTVPVVNQTVSNLSQVVVKLNETTSGVNFVNSTFRLTHSTGETQVEVPVNMTSNGADTATLTLLQPIALDGSDDGTYTIEVTPTDLAGNMGAVVRRQFYLVSQTQPQVKLTAPSIGTVNSLDSVTVEIDNYIGSGINFDASTISVRNAQGLIVPQAKVESDATNNQLTWSTEATIPRNGTADGEYTITATFVDFSGRRFTWRFPLLLDTQFPAINKVQVITDPQQQLSHNSATNIAETFSQVTVEFDKTDIDFENTIVSLTGPDEAHIALHRSNDGDTVLTLNFPNLSQSGTYTLAVTPQDRIGNVSENPFVYRFRLDIGVPVVTTVLIDGQSSAVAYVNGTASDITATLVDTTGTGLAFGEGESSIVVTSVVGLPVPGITTTNVENQLVWRPIALPDDGSVDGRYTVAVTPVDKAGHTGDVAYRAFIYDTQVPRITAATPVTLHQPISYIGGSLTQFQFTIEDVGPALLELDDQTIGFSKQSGEPVPGQITHDGSNQLFFTLSAPLPTDGSADGEYTLTVNLIDKAVNPYQVEHNIFYDSQAPRLSTVSLNTETPLNLTPYQVTDLSESINKLTLNFAEATRVDFENTMITLMGPDGSAIPLTLENNGIDQITASFVSLTQGGLYTLSVTPQDITGNAAQGAVPYPFRLKFEVPDLTSVKANTANASLELIQHEIIDISETLRSLTLEFTDATRVDFENTRVVLTGPGGQEILVTQESGDDSQLMVRFVSLTQSGLYTLSVSPQDVAGNVAQSPVRYQFRLDIALPIVSSILIDGKLGTNVYVNNANTDIVVTFTDATGVGLALGDNGSTIVVTGAEGLPVSSIITSNGTNQLTWTPTALPTDGSADGRYTVTITPIDKSGRSGTVVNRHFIYDTQAPRITASTPTTLHQPISYIGGSLTQFEFTIEDVGPALLDLDDQTIEFKKTEGEVVAGQITHNGFNQLFFTLSAPLPTDGSADGEYTLTINLVDKAGNPYQIEHNIFYDSQAPQLSAVSLNTETALDLTPYQVTDLYESINKLTLNFVEATRVDFTETVIMLIGQDGSSISLTLENNGIDKITASFVTLTQGGLYTLSVTPQDIAGNVAQGAVLYPFKLVFKVLGLASVKANTAKASVELIQHEIVEISESVNGFTLEFTDTTRVDSENTRVALTGPNGQEIPVTQEDNDSAQLVVRFASLTQNGLYTLAVTPQDITGNVAQGPVLYPFRLQFKVPGLSSVKANIGDVSLDLIPYEIVEISESFSSLTFEFTDAARIDFASTRVTLTGPNGQEIPVTQEDNDSTQLVVRFVSLTQSGLYTLAVTPQDKAGNVAQSAIRYQIRLEIALPMVSSVLIDGQIGATIYANNADTSIIATFTEPTDAGIDLGDGGSTIVVANAEGILVPGIITSNGTNQLTWTPTAFPADGSADGRYTVTITPIDKSGRSGTVVNRQFIYDTQAPHITSATPVTLHQPISYIGGSLTQFQFTVADVGPASLDLDDQIIGLNNKNGEAVPAQITHDGTDQLFFTLSAPLPTDGSADGEYTLTVNLVDKAGNPHQVEHHIFYDSQAPRLSTVSLSTETPLNLTPYQVTDLSESINKLTLNFIETTRVDFENTVVTLIGPDNSPIPLTLENNGVDQLTASFVSLTQGGLYTLSVMPQDIADNVAQGSVPYQFRLEFQVPGLSSVKANTAEASVALIQHEIIEISESVSGFTLEFTDTTRVDFENTGVALTGPNDQEIPVTLEDDDGSQLMVRFVALTQNGLYTLAVTPQDRTGNVAQGVALYQFRLQFKVPGLSSVKANTEDASLELVPYEIVEIVESVRSLTLEFTDATQVDFKNTSVALTGPNDQEIPVTLEDDDGSQLVVRFVSLTQSGLYTLSVTPQDIAGNVAQGAVPYPFRLKFEVPGLASVKANTVDRSLELTSYEITDISESINSVTLEFTDAMRVDFQNTSVTLTGADGQEIPVTLENDDDSQLVVRFVSLTQSGLYTLSVTPQDIAGNVAQGAVPYPFRLKFEVPGLASVKANTVDRSLELTSYEITDISESINSVTLEFTDAMRVDFQNTRVTLSGPDGQEIPVTSEDDDDSQLVVRFVSLTQSGLYTLSVTPQDIAGNVAQGAVPYPFRLKFEVPGLASVKANTVDRSLELTSYEITDISESINSVTLEFTDAMRVDFQNTSVTLTGADGQEIPVTLENDDDSQLAVRFVSLTQSGLYTLSVTPQDIAGNVAQSAIRYQFRLDIALPIVSSVLIDGKLGTNVYVNNANTNIIATFTEQTDARIDFGNDGSTIVVTNAEGVLVHGIITSNGTNQLTWTPAALPTDGSADGRYTVTITPVDKSGRSGTVVNRHFIYDTQNPRITATTPATLHQPISYIGGSLAQFQFTVVDVGPASLDLDDQTIGFKKKSGEAVSGQITHDGTDQLFFTLSTPLPTDGSADGEYTLTVNLVDKAGNPHQVEHHIFYDSQAPRLSTVSLSTETPLNLTPYQVTDLSESINKLTLNFIETTRVDFKNTVITLIGPDNSPIPLTLENNGVDQLTASFVSLTQGGLYTLSVMPQDKAGNAAQGAVQYPFRLKFEVPGLASVKVNTADASLELTSYETTEISETISSLTLEFTDAMRVDFQNTSVILTGADGQEIPVTLENDEGSQLVVRFVSLTQSGLYTLSVTPQDKAGNVAQGAVPYPFRLKFKVPGLASVKANTTKASVALIQHEIIEISETISSLTLEFTDATRIDFQNTSVTLTGPNGQEIPITFEDDGSQLMVRFVPLTQGGLYTLSVMPQDKAGNAAQGAALYQFRLQFKVPGLSSVKANTADASLELTSYETTEISETISSLTLEFTDAMRVDFQNTSVALTGPNDQEIPVTLEDDDGSQLVVRFVSLTQSGLYTLSVTPQDIAGNVAQGAVQYPFRLKFEVPGLASVKANTADASLELTSYETTEMSETINSLTLEFTDATRVDFQNTSVTLTGADGQEIPVTLENDEGSQLVVRFVSLTQSGLYTLSVTPQDKAGNVAQGAVPYPFRLKFEVPGLASVKANTTKASVALIQHEIIEISETISSLTLEFTDATRIDFQNTSVTLTGPNDQEIPITFEDDGSQLMVRFVSLTQSGLYTLIVIPQDKVGNAAQGAALYQFRLQFKVPGLSSVKANTADASLELTSYETTEISETISSLTLEFTDAMRVDFQNTSVALTGPNDQEIPVTLEDDEGSQLVVRFVSLTQSGLYTLSVTPQDKAGNVAQGAVPYPFRLKFEVPGLASVKANTADASLELTSYETTEISETINSLTLEFTDAMRVDFQNTSVTLTGADGQEIPVTLENDDDSQLVVRFVSLTQSGLYTLAVTPQDIAGNVAQGAVPYPFRLKFEVPGLASVKANTTKASVALIQHEIIEISETISSLILEFTDATRINFQNTSVTLTGPNDQEIPITFEDDGSQLMVRFVSLTQSGLYTLIVIPQDKAGNTAQNAIRYQFRLETALPTVNSILIDGKPGSTVYVSRSILKIVATIADSIGVGVSLGDGGSNIVVTNAQGLQVNGVTTSNGTNQLTWTPTPLPTDGSADGQYTVAVTPVDKAGRSGTVVNRQFIYDTQAPRITAATPLTMHAPISYIGGGLNQFVLTIEDVGPAGLVLASQVVVLMDATGKPVSAAMTYDELTDQLYLTLSKPFANDGSVDGTYTLNVLLIDKAGNRTNSRFTLVYDSKAPQVSLVQVNTAGTPMDLVPNQVAELSESISTITLKFEESTRVDFANTALSLIGPDDQTIPLTREDDGVSQLTLSFVDLTQSGQYTFSVTPQDVAGNAAQSPIEFSFNLEFILPTVESVIIGDTVTLGSGDIAYVNADNIVIAANLLDPASTGLSFDSTTGSDLLVATLDGIIVLGATATNGTDLIIWRPLTLSTDGSSDGRYAVYVTPVDKKGREGNTIYREFVFDTQEPEITDANPINLSQPVSYISESLTQLQFTLQDVGPADLTLADQKVSLRNQGGSLIPTKLTNDTNNQLFLTLDEPLPLDGSKDGKYTVVIAFSDKAGNVLSVEHPIVYDTQAPTLVSTVPADGALLTEDITQIQVNLNDKGESGIDWSLTTVTLVDPNGAEISGEITSNGKTQLTLNTNQLVADGRYVIRVQAIDRAGNGSQSVFERSFLLSRRLPAIISTSPSTAPKDEAFTNEKVDQIDVLLETIDERHLSTLRLLNAAGQVVAGQQYREPNKLIYRLVRPLATDGSEDGLYTIEFTPISASGRSGAVQKLVFVYDRQVPEINPDGIHLIVAEPEVNNSLTEIRVDLTDNQAGIDWENLDEEWLTFEQLSPNATKIAGRVSYEQDTLIFRLTVPLADNGSADGEYQITVNPIDKAGNGDETYEKVFTYDASPPVIDPNSLLINDAPLLTDIDAEDYPNAISTTGGVVIQASVTDTGLGVNLSQSRIVIRNPNGQEISGTTRQNGVDTISFKSDGLNIEGIYQVTITGTGNDSELLGFAPKGSITTAFLYETTSPTALVTNDGGKTELTDEALPLEGAAADPQGTRRAGPQQEGEIPVPASGVWLVEIVGTGPDGQPIEPVPTEDESNAQEQPWSRWSVDFLPARSGEYDLDLRVTDKAGNFTVYDIGEYTMSVSFSFRGKTFGWPNPLRHSKNDVAFFSFDLNASADETVELVLYIYDWSGDMVYSKTYTDITPGQRNDTQIKWNLENQAGTPVARGLYVFRLEAVNGAGNRANAVGKILVVD